MRKSTNDTMLHLLEFIKEFQTNKGYFPTVREMASFLNVKSTCTVSYYLDKLCKKGILKKDNKKSRALEFLIPEDKWHNILQIKNQNVTKFSYKNTSSYFHEDTIDIPILGNVTAGQPMLAIEEYDQTWTLPYEIFNKSNLYILDVKGDSMINAGIFDGDKIVCSKQENAINGDIVVALIDDSATIKRFFKEKNKVRLQPENDCGI